MITSNGDALIYFIGAALKQDAPPHPCPRFDFDGLFKLGRIHDVLIVLNAGIKAAGQSIPVEIADKYRGLLIKDAYRFEAQQAALKEISDGLERLSVKAVPLKGGVLRRFYPDPSFRSCCDIDVLFDPEKADGVKCFFADRGYTLKLADKHNLVFVKPPYLNVEMHFSLMSDRPEYASVFEDYLEKSTPVEGYKYICRFSDEDFYVYMIAHLAKHFINGGSGVRSIADVYVFLKSRGAALDRAYIAKRLESIGLERFEQAVRELSEAWFGNSERGGQNRALSDYVIGCGTFGTVRNWATNEISEKGRFKYVFHMAFPSYKIMCRKYGFLKKAPFLVPVFWVVRWFGVLDPKTRKRLRSKQPVYSKSSSVSPKTLSELYRFIGIK